MKQNRSKTIFEQFYDYVFFDEKGICDGEWVHFSDPAEIIELFNWNGKQRFIDTTYRDYIEGSVNYDYSQYGSEPILSEENKLFYTIGTDEFVGNLWGVVGYRYYRAEPKTLETFCDNLKVEYGNFRGDCTIDIFADFEAGIKRIRHRRSRGIYTRFDLMDFE